MSCDVRDCRDDVMTDSSEFGAGEVYCRSGFGAGEGRLMDTGEGILGWDMWRVGWPGDG